MAWESQNLFCLSFSSPDSFSLYFVGIMNLKSRLCLKCSFCFLLKFMIYFYSFRPTPVQPFWYCLAIPIHFLEELVLDPIRSTYPLTFVDLQFSFVNHAHHRLLSLFLIFTLIICCLIFHLFSFFLQHWIH